MHRALEPLLGPTFPALLRASLRRRRLPESFLRPGWAEEIRQAAALALLQGPPPPADAREARARVRRALGHACWRLIERERWIARRRIPLEDAAHAPAREEGRIHEAEWEERLARLSPPARDLVGTLLAARPGGRGIGPLARAAGVRRRDLPPLLAEILLSLLGGSFREEAGTVLRTRLTELEGGLPRLSARSRRWARRLASVLHCLPVGWGLRETAARVAALERGSRRRAAGGLPSGSPGREPGESPLDLGGEALLTVPIRPDDAPGGAARRHAVDPLPGDGHLDGDRGVRAAR
jgi:hypothetical protein